MLRTADVGESGKETSQMCAPLGLVLSKIWQFLLAQSGARNQGRADDTFSRVDPSGVTEGSDRRRIHPAEDGE